MANKSKQAIIYSTDMTQEMILEVIDVANFILEKTNKDQEVI